MVLWLDDSRAIDILIDLLPQRDRGMLTARGRVFALSLLNQLEFGKPPIAKSGG
jgi:hypothetical protein